MGGECCFVEFCQIQTCCDQCPWAASWFPQRDLSLLTAISCGFAHALLLPGSSHAHGVPDSPIYEDTGPPLSLPCPATLLWEVSIAALVRPHLEARLLPTSRAAGHSYAADLGEHMGFLTPHCRQTPPSAPPAFLICTEDRDQGVHTLLRPLAQWTAECWWAWPVHFAPWVWASAPGLALFRLPSPPDTPPLMQWYSVLSSATAQDPQARVFFSACGPVALACQPWPGTSCSAVERSHLFFRPAGGQGCQASASSS